MASNFNKNRDNFSRELSLNIIISFPLLLVVLLLRDAPKNILSKPQWKGSKQSLGGYGAPGPTGVTALATSTKNDTPVAIGVARGGGARGPCNSNFLQFICKTYEKSKILCYKLQPQALV